MKYYLEIHPNIQKAIFENKPVVVLESTIISHGMPYPDNVAMALSVEEVILNEGAIPATIAIIDGVIKVGLTKDEIEYLAQAKDVLKVSKRDFAYAISQKRTGATTVSATMLIAEMAGLSIFATGGIGGVHRGATKTFDISRDLEELANVNVCVVCAGAKSILDLGLTLEFLETKGVEIIGYKTKSLPAFYTRDSKFEVDYQLDSPTEIANLIFTKWDMGLRGGVVVANPIPDAYSLDSSLINKAIEKALLEAEEKQIKGKEITPFLLSKVKEITGGESLASNIELMKNNAKLAALIAINFAKHLTA